MGNEYGAADLQPHLVCGATLHKWVSFAATADTVILAGGYHQKMRLRQATVQVSTAAVNATGAVFTLYHGGNAVVAAADMNDAKSSAVGDVYPLTIVDQYKDLDPDESVYVTVTIADAGTSDGFFILEYELVE